MPVVDDDAHIRSVLLSVAVDIICVLVFCALGRRSHAEGLTVAGIAETGLPFLTGTATGWLLARGWRRPTALAPTGVTVWAATVLVGILLRMAVHAEHRPAIAPSFWAVAALVTAVLLLGWRAVLAAARR